MEEKNTPPIKKRRDTQKLVKPESESNLQEIFIRETGKNAIWRGKETKGYLEWKKKYSTKNKD